MTSFSCFAARPRLPRQGAPLSTLLGICVAAALILWGSIEVHRQSAQALSRMEGQCSKIPAARDRALCSARMQDAATLERRSGEMLWLQGLCFALIAAGLFSLLRLPRKVARQRTESVRTPRPDAAPPGRRGADGEFPSGTDRDRDPLQALARISAAYCEGELTGPRLLAALTGLNGTIEATRLGLHLDSLASQALGTGPLVCTSPTTPLPARDGLADPRDMPSGQAASAAEAPVRVPVGCGGTVLGTLLIEPAQQTGVSEEQLRLARTFADITALAMAGVCGNHEDRRIALMEERSAIAGELHDSLSQSLAFMKIQVVRLQHALERDESRPDLLQAAGELRSGLSAAYRQVRELIAAFRVRMEPGGLVAAVQDAIEELGQHGGLDIAFEHDFGACRLEANEEFHVMQIVREALFNTVRHAGATQAWVDIRYDADMHLLRASVADNGRGPGAVSDPGKHHGLSVMQQRARSLQGELSLGKRPEGGTVVQLHFAPLRLAASAHGHGRRP